MLRTQADEGAGRDQASVTVDRLVSTATRAAISISDGMPRRTLTSGSASIDRAYDIAVAISAVNGDTRPTLG